MTTAFPVDQAIGDLAPGVYVMTAEAKGATARRSTARSRRQWFIVSDLGLAAFSGNDGINVFVNSLATTAAEGRDRGAADVAQQRSAGDQRTDASGRVQFEAGLARGEGALSPAMLIAAEAKGDYAFLNLKSPGLRPDRPRRRGPRVRRPASTPSSIPSAASIARAKPCTSPRCCATPQGVAALNVPMTLVVERPDGVEYRRVAVADQGVGGRSLERADQFRRPRPAPGACAPSPIRRARGRRDELPGRGLCARPPGVRSCRRLPGPIGRRQPAEITVDGRYLYGAPASGLDSRRRTGDRGGAGSGRASRLPVRRRPTRTSTPSASRSRTCRRPTTRAKRSFTVSARQAAGNRRVRSRRRSPCGWRSPAAARSSASSRCRSCRPRNMIGVKPLFSGRSLGEGETATLRRGDGGARRQAARRETVCATNCSRSSSAISGIAATAAGTTSRSSRPAASRTAGSMSPPTSPAASRCRCTGAATGSKSRPRSRTGPPTSVAFDAGCYAEASADTPDLLEIALDKPEYRAGRHHDGRRHRAHRRQGHAQRHRRPAAGLADARRPGRHRAHSARCRQRLGHRRLCGGDAAPPARRARAAHARPRHRRAMVRRSTRRRARSRST